MNRRKALKNTALSLGGMIVLPDWAKAWRLENEGRLRFVSSDEEVLLAELVETIIPQTDTIGAKELGVHQFVQKMISDCYNEKAQANFKKNLSEIDPLSIKFFGKPFVEANASQRLNIVQSLAQSTDKERQDFYKTLRDLTIQGFKSSEYYLTHYTDYEMAPARFYGCVPVKTK